MAFEQDELLLAYQELDDAADRISAIWGTTLVENRLQRAICARFITDDPKACERFFAPGAGLGDFRAKISLGYLLGIYDLETRQSLTALSRIRNKFTEKTKIREFSHQELEPFFEDLKIVARLPALHASTNPDDRLLQALLPPNLPAGRFTRRLQFLAATKLLLAYLFVDALDAKSLVAHPTF